MGAAADLTCDRACVNPGLFCLGVLRIVMDEIIGQMQREECCDAPVEALA